MNIWVMAADASCAKLFAYHGSTDDLHEIETINNPSARLHEQGLVSDRGGAALNGSHNGSHGVNGEKAAKKHQQERFAKSICDRLYKGYLEREYTRLYVTASPTILGELRHHYHSQVNASIAGELDKNLAEHSAADIRHHLPKVLT